MKYLILSFSILFASCGNQASKPSTVDTSDHFVKLYGVWQIASVIQTDSAYQILLNVPMVNPATKQPILDSLGKPVFNPPAYYPLPDSCEVGIKIELN